MTTTTTTTPPPIKPKPTVCFSFAAYSKHLITHLHHHSNVPVAHGLTQTELATIESTFNFTFPPDLRAILREGLPVGNGFPDWRTSSHQQLDILINLPILGLCKEVSRNRFWYGCWGDRPNDDDQAVELAKRFLKRYPVLVPVYRNCYVSTSPCLSGNPVFYVNGLDVKLCSYDVVGLFNQIEFKEGVVSGMRLGHFLSAPAWAATDARMIEFWTKLVELRRVKIGSKSSYDPKFFPPLEIRKEWWGGNELGRCLEDVRLRLRDGGWKDEDLDEMMLMVDSSSTSSISVSPPSSSVASWASSSDDDVMAVRDDTDEVVRVLSRKLLRGGWSMGDVVESLGCLTEYREDRTVEMGKGGGGDSLFDFEHMCDSCVHEGQSEVNAGIGNTC